MHTCLEERQKYMYTVTAIMMLHKDTKIKVYSPDRDTDFFDIVAGLLQRGNISRIVVYNLPKLHEIEII